jgi:hypothetical protein
VYWLIRHNDEDYAGVGNQWFRSKIIEFFEGFKEQRNLYHFKMNLCLGRGAPQLDINYLVSHSVRFHTLELHPCSVQDVNANAAFWPIETGTLSHASIPTIDLQYYGFDSMLGVLLSCLKMVHLHINWPAWFQSPEISEVIGSTILQNRSSRLILFILSIWDLGGKES